MSQTPWPKGGRNTHCDCPGTWYAHAYRLLIPTPPTQNYSWPPWGTTHPMATEVDRNTKKRAERSKGVCKNCNTIVKKNVHQLYGSATDLKVHFSHCTAEWVLLTLNGLTAKQLFMQILCAVSLLVSGSKIFKLEKNCFWKMQICQALNKTGAGKVAHKI